MNTPFIPIFCGRKALCTEHHWPLNARHARCLGGCSYWYRRGRERGALVPRLPLPGAFVALSCLLSSIRYPSSPPRAGSAQYAEHIGLPTPLPLMLSALLFWLAHFPTLGLTSALEALLGGALATSYAASGHNVLVPMAAHRCACACVFCVSGVCDVWVNLRPLLCLPCPALPCPALPCPALPCAALPCIHLVHPPRDAPPSVYDACLVYMAWASASTDLRRRVQVRPPKQQTRPAAHAPPPLRHHPLTLSPSHPAPPPLRPPPSPSHPLTLSSSHPAAPPLRPPPSPSHPAPTGRGGAPRPRPHRRPALALPPPEPRRPAPAPRRPPRGRRRLPGQPRHRRRVGRYAPGGRRLAAPVRGVFRRRPGGGTLPVADACGAPCRGGRGCGGWDGLRGVKRSEGKRSG